MIIPANEIVAEKWKNLYYPAKTIIRDISYYLEYHMTDDDIIMCNVLSDSMIFDIPKKGQFNGAGALMDHLNKVWTYHPDTTEKVADYYRIDREGFYIRVKWCSETTDSNREYLFQVKTKKIEMEEI